MIQILFIENSVSADRNCNRTSIFLQNFFTQMEQILVLTLFQCIVGDLFTKASKIFDSGANHFLAKRHLPGGIQILFIQNSVSEAKNCNFFKISSRQ